MTRNTPREPDHSQFTFVIHTTRAARPETQSRHRWRIVRHVAMSVAGTTVAYFISTIAAALIALIAW